MTDPIGLKDLAQRAPTPRLGGDGLWHHGRRLRRRRQTTGAAAALLVLATLAIPSWLATRPDSLGPSQSDSVTAPSSVDRPYFWQATVDVNPNGPAKLIFMHNHNIGFEGGPVIIGLDDSYRVLIGSPDDEVGEVSPNGRYLVHRRQGKAELLDTITGKSRVLDPGSPFHQALGWSRDSSQLLLMLQHDELSVTYGPDDQPSDPSRADNIVLYDMVTGAKRHLLTTHTYAVAGGFSPDGSRLALTVGKEGGAQRLLILDAQTGATEREVPLTTKQKLLGPVPWTPDGKAVTLAVTSGCGWFGCRSQTDIDARRWHLQYVDVATGEITDEAARGRTGTPERLVGWRDDNPIMVNAGHQGYEPTLIRVTPDGGMETLLRTPVGARSLRVPQDVAEQATFGGPNISPSPFAAQTWAYITALYIIALLALFTWLTIKVIRHFQRHRSPTPTR